MRVGRQCVASWGFGGACVCDGVWQGSPRTGSACRLSREDLATHPHLLAQDEENAPPAEGGSPLRRRRQQRQEERESPASSPWIERELRVLRAMCEDNRRACSGGGGAGRAQVAPLLLHMRSQGLLHEAAAILSMEGSVSIVFAPAPGRPAAGA